MSGEGRCSATVARTLALPGVLAATVGLLVAAARALARVGAMAAAVAL